LRLVKPSPKARRREATHQRIVDAALAVFASQGPAAPIDAVCRVAGCSKGAFYHYFRNRSQLEAALAAQAGGDLVRVAEVRPDVAGLLSYLWAEGCRRRPLRQRLASAIRRLPVMFDESPGDSWVGEEASAMLSRLLFLGRLVQRQLWSPVLVGEGQTSEGTYAHRSVRKPGGPGGARRAASGR